MLGLDGETIIVGGKVYYVEPPSIKKIVGCGYYLSDYGGEESLGDYLRKIKDLGSICKALSWLVVGNESKADDLMEGTMDEVISGIEVGMSLIGTANFPRLSVLSKSVQELIAKPSR